MKTIIHAAITALFVAGATATAHAAAIPAGCVPAVQNWQNGSGYTCPVADTSSVNTPFVHKPKKCEGDDCGGGEEEGGSKSRSKS